MTILGVAAGTNHGTVWSDTLVVRGGQPWEHVSKLSINALSRVIGVSSGLQALTRDGHEALLSNDCLDDAVKAVANALRTAAFRYVTRPREREAGWLLESDFALVGWSPAEGRMHGYRFAAVDFFEPRRITCLTWPRVEVPFHGAPLSANQVLDAATRQTVIHRDYGGHVGQLLVATISEFGVIAHAPVDLPIPVTATEEPAVATEEPAPPAKIALVA